MLRASGLTGASGERRGQICLYRYKRKVPVECSPGFTTSPLHKFLQELGCMDLPSSLRKGCSVA